MVNSYLLVNPHIEGNFKSKLKAKNSLEAAHMFYTNLSEHFNNSVPKFYFTIQKGSSGDGKYYHFEVKEDRANDEVTFKINPLKVSNSDTVDSFKNKLANFKSKFGQDGGKKSKHHKKTSGDSSDDSDDSSDSSDLSDLDSDDKIYKRAKSYMPSTLPIYYWWYDPYLYSLDSIYIPTFYSYVTPYIELSIKY